MEQPDFEIIDNYEGKNQYLIIPKTSIAHMLTEQYKGVFMSKFTIPNSLYDNFEKFCNGGRAPITFEHVNWINITPFMKKPPTPHELRKAKQRIRELSPWWAERDFIVWYNNQYGLCMQERQDGELIGHEFKVDLENCELNPIIP